ncbi:MAG: hypothetical protein KatS3mg111_1753 [Pirellulaceae bacterium]|nr:MAG: hypothetical protein KatS3mg111_1753 [Pirellulaceae bacterium]
MTVGPTENALQVADQLGRPVAILRIGSRSPPRAGEALHEFLYGCPPWIPSTAACLIAKPWMAAGQWPDAADAAPSPSDEAPNASAPEPRVPLPLPPVAAMASGDPCSPTMTPGQTSQPIDPHAYVYDGGDAPPQAEVREDWTAAGVEPTETIAFYDTTAGTVCVTTTNRVAIYAPRFAAIRQVSGAIMAAAARGPEGMITPVATARFADSNNAGAVMQPLAPHGQQQVGLIDALEEQQIGVKMERVVPLQRMSDARFAIEGFDVLTTSEITDAEIAVLGKVIQNAHAWWSPESLEVMLNGQGAALATKASRPKELLHYETKDRCSLRIIKGASSSVALPGDVIRFTLRFDNHGPHPIGNVVLIDNLSSRLEYVEGSQQASVPVRFATTINDVGSSMLRWELEEPLQPYQGGVISFDCRVR